MGDNRKIQSIKVQILDESGSVIDNIWLSMRTAAKTPRIKQFFCFLSEICVRPLSFPASNSSWEKEKKGSREQKV